MDYWVKAYSVVDWGAAWQHNCGPKDRCVDNGRRYLAPLYAIANADQPPLPRLYILVWCFTVVKWRYIKYEALPFLPFKGLNLNLNLKSLTVGPNLTQSKVKYRLILHDKCIQ